MPKNLNIFITCAHIGRHKRCDNINDTKKDPDAGIYGCRGRLFLLQVRAVVGSCFCLFVVLRPSQQLWSCRGSQVTAPHFFLGKLD